MKIGIFDSGIGGLSVLSRVMHLYPGVEYLYYADCVHVPYGEKEPEEVIGFVREILKFLISEGAEAIVIACNTATSVAVKQMREEFSVPIIGMEPAVKLALDLFPSGRILAAATPITVRGEKMHALLEKWDDAHRADLLALPELVRFAERGEFASEAVTAYLSQQLSAFHLEEYCAFVLGCTHFNYFKDTLRSLLPEQVHLIDGVDGTIRRLAACVSLPKPETAIDPRFFESGMPVSDARKNELENCLRRLEEMEKIQ